METLTNMDGITLDMWTPYKQLCSTVERCVMDSQNTGFGMLQGTFQKYKQNFLNVMKNPPKNSKSRNMLKKGESEGILMSGIEYHTIPHDLVEETMVLSDMYDLDELVAFDLLSTAQQQMPSYPGLPRGLVAVMLYYDGHKALATALRTIMQARSGFHWTVDIESGIPDYLAKYSDELVNDGLIDKIIDALKRMDLAQEIELLQANRALGGPKHRHMVTVLFEELKQVLADVIFLYSAQAGLHQTAFFSLMNYMKTVKIEGDASGGIDDVSLALQMALLFAVDVNDIVKRDDFDELADKIPLLNEAGFLECLVEEIKNPNAKWECPGLLALLQFALGITASALRNITMVNFSRGVTDEDDGLVSMAITNDVFSYLHSTFLKNEIIHREEFYVRRLHGIFTDFIVLMPMKVKELKIRSEELSKTSRMYIQEGLNPPKNVPHHFELLLRILTTIYNRDPLKLKLHLDYWFDENLRTTKSGKSKKYSQQISLFKFVKQTGESLHPNLFVSYLEFISSLSSCETSASYTFKLFKFNDIPTLTWDHFFKSFHQYYNNLKIELPPSSDTVYRHRSLYPKGINPMEMHGLQAVLNVIRKVALFDESSRIAFCEHLEWSCLSILMGLVSCSIDLNLKADIIKTLAALAKSEHIANTIWRTMESLQIVPTILTTNVYQPKGVQAELEEIESKNEEFPLTKAMLELLDALVDWPLPRTLGAGSRTPGFDPYLNYILKTVFQRFNSRSYKDPNEKWEIGNLCVELSIKLLNQYEPRVEDVSGICVQVDDGSKIKEVQVSPPPGFHIMCHLSTNSEFLRVILHLIDEGCCMLDLYKKFTGKPAFESLMLSCLELLLRGLELQSEFFDMMMITNCNKIITPLYQLILGINQRTGNPDHLLNIAKYVTYNSWLTMHALTAVKILTLVTSNPVPHSNFLPFFTSSLSLQTVIRHGFVESLEAEESQWTDGSDLTIVGQIKEAIMKLLIQCLPARGANLTHFLMGFDLKNTRKTILQMPGPGVPRTCFHSILSLLNSSLLYRKDKAIFKIHPQLILQAYTILHALCANLNTSDTVLRFLRTSQDFLENNLSLFPFDVYDKVTEFTCMALVLRILTIEFRVVSVNGYAKKLEDLIKLFLTSSAGDELDWRKEFVSGNRKGNEESSLSNAKLFHLLDIIEFETVAPEVPQWQFLDVAATHEMLRQCENPTTNSSVKLVNVKKLFLLLQEELVAFQGTSTTAQRQIIQREINELLVYTVKLNQYKAVLGAQTQYFDAWQKLCNIYFIVAPSHIIPFALRFSLLMEILISLFNKIREHEFIGEEVREIATNAILLLLVDVRQCVKSQKRTLDLTVRGNTLNQMQYYENNLIDLLNTVRSWLLLSGNSSRMVKVNLSSCFLTLVRFCEDEDEKEVEFWLRENSKGETANEFSLRTIRTKMAHSDTNDQLFRMFCEYSIVAHDIWKMVSLSVLDYLIDINPNFISHLASHGYLKSILQKLVDSDIKLCQILSQDFSLAPLYLYEAEMTLLCKIANHPSGAEVLLDEKALCKLGSMDVFNNHPAITKYSPECMVMNSFVPDTESRYLQLFMPLLRLASSVLISVGSDNEEAVAQISALLFNLNETVSLILRSANPEMSPGLISELAHLTSVISPVFGHFIVHQFKDEYQSDKAIQVHKIQKLMLSLLPTFNITPATIKMIGDNSDATQKHPVERSQAVYRYMQVVGQLLLFAQSIVAGTKTERFIQVNIFQPTLYEVDKNKKSSRGIVRVSNTQDLDLGIVVKFIIDGISYYLEASNCISKLKNRLESIPAMTTDELKEALYGDVVHVVESEYKNEASLQILRLIVELNLELDMCYTIIETSMYLLWSHIDYFSLQVMSNTTRTKIISNQYGESSRACTAEQLAELKQLLIPILDETFSMKMTDVTKDRTTSEKGYIEALLRRIKKLIQFVPNK